MPQRMDPVGRRKDSGQLSSMTGHGCACLQPCVARPGRELAWTCDVAGLKSAAIASPALFNPCHSKTAIGIAADRCSNRRRVESNKPHLIFKCILDRLLRQKKIKKKIVSLPIKTDLHNGWFSRQRRSYLVKFIIIQVRSRHAMRAQNTALMLVKSRVSHFILQLLL